MNAPDGISRESLLRLERKSLFVWESPQRKPCEVYLAYRRMEESRVPFRLVTAFDTLRFCRIQMHEEYRRRLQSAFPERNWGSCKHFLLLSRHNQESLHHAKKGSAGITLEGW
jgi:hypothetical protein